MEDLTSILRPLLEHAYEVELTGFGEIFCHPQIEDILRYLRQSRLQVNATSNGHLWPAGLWRTIVSEGLLDMICVSLDAGSAATYAALRAGGEFAKVIDNLRMLQCLKHESGALKPRLHLSFLTVKSNLAELPGAVRLAAELGAERFIVQGLFENAAMHGQSTAFDPAEKEAFAAAAGTAEEIGLPLEFWYQSQAAVNEGEAVQRVQITSPYQAGRPLVKDCLYPWERVFVKSNLDVQACATVWEKLVMGNLRRQTIEEIWHGPAYAELRRRLAGTHPPAECAVCATKSWTKPHAPEETTDALDLSSPECRQIGQGFYSVETGPDGKRYRWTTGNCTIFLHNSHRPFLDYELFFHPNTSSTKANLLINDQFIDQLNSRSATDGRLRFVMPYLEDEMLKIELVFDPPTTPEALGAGASRRPLGALVRRAALAGGADSISSTIKIGQNCGDHLGSGFYEPEASFRLPMRWTADRASFAVSGEENSLVEIELLIPSQLPEQQVHILVNGKECKEVALTKRSNHQIIRVPLGPPKSWHVVTLVSKYIWEPGGADTRQLGVLFAGARTIRSQKPDRRRHR